MHQPRVLSCAAGREGVAGGLEGGGGCREEAEFTWLLPVVWIETQQEEEIELGALRVDVLCVNKLCSESRVCLRLSCIRRII